MNNQAFVAFWTIFSRECARFIRIWSQTLLPPLITMLLYFLIFGHLIGPRIGLMQNIPYNEYISPGLVMLAVINTAYSNVSSSVFTSRFQRNIEEILISPTSYSVLILGVVLGGIIRGILVGLGVSLICFYFIGFHIAHPLLMLLVLLLCSSMFALMGFLNGIYAKTFDDIMIIPSFVLTPLIYLGGVFYSVHLLPALWAKLSLLNPILHIVNAFRYSWLNVSDIPITAALSMLIAVNIILYVLNIQLLNRGSSIRS